MNSAEETRLDWTDQVKSNYNVESVDFTRDFPEGIVVFLGSRTVPPQVFKNGFKPNTESIWIEDSSYLLSGDQYKVLTYVQKQKNLNRSVIPDKDFRIIVPPGKNRGLISTTLSPKKAAWHVCLSFLKNIKKRVLQQSNEPNVLFSHMNYAVRCASKLKAPIGYVYAIRIKKAINISADFQWMDLSEPDLIEQEMACYNIPGQDVIWARPVYTNLIEKKGHVCYLETAYTNSKICNSLVSFKDLYVENSFDSINDKKIGTDESLALFHRLNVVGTIGFFPNDRQFHFFHDEEESLSLDDSKFSRHYIKPYISKTKEEYLERLRERQHVIIASPTNYKRR